MRDDIFNLCDKKIVDRDQRIAELSELINSAYLLLSDVVRYDCHNNDVIIHWQEKATAMLD